MLYKDLIKHRPCRSGMRNLRKSIGIVEYLKFRFGKDLSCKTIVFSSIPCYDIEWLFYRFNTTQYNDTVAQLRGVLDRYIKGHEIPQSYGHCQHQNLIREVHKSLESVDYWLSAGNSAFVAANTVIDLVLLMVQHAREDRANIRQTIREPEFINTVHELLDILDESDLL